MFLLLLSIITLFVYLCKNKENIKKDLSLFSNIIELKEENKDEMKKSIKKNENNKNNNKNKQATNNIKNKKNKLIRNIGSKSKVKKFINNKQNLFKSRKKEENPTQILNINLNPVNNNNFIIQNDDSEQNSKRLLKNQTKKILMNKSQNKSPKKQKIKIYYLK